MAQGSYVVERSTTIAADPQQVWDQVTDFHRWVSWSPWEGLDPDIHRTYSGPDSGTGASYAWAGNRKAGTGKMEITGADPGRVTIDLRFDKPYKQSSVTEFVISPQGPSSTNLTWSMTGPQTVMIKIMGVFSSMDSLIGKDFERGLAQLKSVLETGTPDDSKNDSKDAAPGG